jgi:hypothetical protein
MIQAADFLRRNALWALEEAVGLPRRAAHSFSVKVCRHPEHA